jgi:hypothetical protein
MTPILRSVPVALALFPAALALAEDTRTDLQATQIALDRAVAEVSQPSVHFVLGGRETTRAYRLKGVGAFFVLPPRALPRGERDRLLVFDRRAPGRGAPQKLSKEQERELRAVQMQVEAMQRDADAMQQEAERALETVERNVRIRLVGPSAPQPPEAPEAPAPAEAPMSPDLLQPPPPPPWHFWFGTAESPDDRRSPERVIADVQGAVTAALEAQGASLRTVPSDESILVAVDFLPSHGFDLDEPPRAERSLIVKVKKRDLSERSSGKISAEEFRHRIEYTQY